MIIQTIYYVLRYIIIIIVTFKEKLKKCSQITHQVGHILWVQQRQQELCSKIDG